MWRRRRQAPGELIYLSDTKLYAWAAALGIKSDHTASIELEGTAGARIKAPPLDVSAQRRVQKTQVDPGAEVRAKVELLERVLARLDKPANLEKNEDILEGDLFCFHRFLRFGVGYSDAGPPIKALVVVDGEPVPRNFSRLGLLMNGSIGHVWDPYATDELRMAEGSRSGSGTERLFNWLDESRRAWEDDPVANLRTILSRTERPPHGADNAIEMYELFARRDWLGKYLAEPVMHGAPCEGVARASFIAPGEGMTVVMGSPLYIRISPLRNT
jgi:hypothetical protein